MSGITEWHIQMYVHEWHYRQLYPNTRVPLTNAPAFSYAQNPRKMGQYR